MKLTLIAASLISALVLADAASIKCEKKYEVKAKDTCKSIAKKFDLSESKLEKYNKELNSKFDCKKLKAKKTICVKFPKESKKTTKKHKNTTTKKDKKAATKKGKKATTTKKHRVSTKKHANTTKRVASKGVKKDSKNN